MVQNWDCQGCTQDYIDSYNVEKSRTGYSAPATWLESSDNINMVDTGSLDKFDGFYV